MKAIILERRGDMAALLCEDGTFETRRIAGEVGETVELTAKVSAFPAKKRWMRSVVAAALALAVTGGTLGYMGGTASAYVSLDVDEDSAIELTVNHFGRVIAVNALSDDTAALAKSLTGEVRHKKPEDALEHTMKRLREEGYLGEQDAAVVAGVTSDNTSRAAELRQSVERAVGEDAELYVSEASRAERRQAMDENRSAGRFAFERDRGVEPWGGRDEHNMEPPAPQEKTQGEPVPPEPPQDEAHMECEWGVAPGREDGHKDMADMTAEDALAPPPERAEQNRQRMDQP